MPTLLVIGATSDIAIATTHFFAQKGFDLVLVGRNPKQLSLLKKDLEIRFQRKVYTHVLDVEQLENHERFLNSLPVEIDGALMAIGYLPDQQKAEKEVKEIEKTIWINYTGPTLLLQSIANYLETRNGGFIIGISSVAGDRGRRSNYIYGGAKAGFSAFLSGLRNRYYQAGIHVITVKPGFVRTKMTSHLSLPEPLVAEPERIARDIWKAYQKKKDIVYTPWYWRWIMLLIRLLPEFWFKKKKW